MMNSSTGTRGFVVPKELNILKNESFGYSIQVNYPQSEETLKGVMGIWSQQPRDVKG
jgi:hypothetical protein